MSQQRGEPGPCAPGRAWPGAASSLAGAQRRPGCGPVSATTFQRQLAGGTGSRWCSHASWGHLPVPSTGWRGAGGSAPLCHAVPLCHAAQPGTAAVWICSPTITEMWKQTCERGINVPKSLSLRCVGWDPGLGVMCAIHVLCPCLPRGAEPHAVCVLAEKEEIDHPNNSFSPCSIHDRKCLQKQQAKRVNNGNKMRNSGSPYHREETRPIAQGSCQSELHRALERLAASQTRTHEDLYVIPIPNCDRNGNFHPKQCHPALDGQRGKCWCVDRKTGVKLPGFLELKGDLDCHQLADSILANATKPG
uniref:Thyroglobulin type-1 domain-containing protein n=1 Tax=Anas platyrhynchos platyrhynchos TaxID=8840 RepID=A0A493TEG1_ANAPP